MKQFVAVLLGVALAATGARSATRSYAVTWNTAGSQWALDGIAAPELTLVPALTYEFVVVGGTAGAKFWFSFSDNFNDTASALKPEDGVTNNLCTPPCTVRYVPPASDLNQAFYYLSSAFDDAGNVAYIKRCADLAGETACEKAPGCGWTTTCVSCSSLTGSAATCQTADTCSWCFEPTEGCVAETDTTCTIFISEESASFFISSSENGASFVASSEEGTQMLYLLFLLLLIPIAGAIFAVVMVVKKSTHKKHNEAMFRIEDEMAVLGGHTAADDNTL